MLALPQMPPRWQPAHNFAQHVGLVLTAVLIFGLAAWPRPTLHVLWDMVIPLLPAVFLINPMLWRNVCPLATLNSMTGVRRTGQLAKSHLKAGWVISLVLLALMVPARRFLFNSDGLALALTIVAVVAIAQLGGVLAPRRAGFCNSLCPVLPVEKLYGQTPLVTIPTARCADCSVCTPLACIDLARDKTVRQTLGPRARTTAWLATPFGLFAAAFPGFIIAYFTLSDGPLSSAGSVYKHMLLWTLGSMLTTAAVVIISRASALLGIAVLGGLAIALYYWYAAPTVSAAYGGNDTAALMIRLTAISLVLWWFLRAKSWRSGAYAVEYNSA
jgi:hypothetical protein